MRRLVAVLVLFISLACCSNTCCEEDELFSQDTAGVDSMESVQEEQTLLTWEEELALYQSNRDTIYLFITEELKLNHAVACGIIANIHYESRFNPEALGDYGTSYGICQWHNRRYTSLINWCGENGYDYTTLEAQLYYMKYELDNYYAFVYTRLKSIPNTKRGAYTAGNYWCVYFEKPKNRYVSGDLRGELARQRYWDILKTGN